MKSTWMQLMTGSAEVNVSEEHVLAEHEKHVKQPCQFQGATSAGLGWTKVHWPQLRASTHSMQLLAELKTAEFKSAEHEWPELLKLICMQLMSGSAEAMCHIHVSVEHKKYQSQLKIYAVRFGWFEGKVGMPHLSYILIWIWFKKPSCSDRLWLTPNHLKNNNMMYCHVSDCLSEKLTKTHANLCGVNQINLTL